MLNNMIVRLQYGSNLLIFFLVSLLLSCNNEVERNAEGVINSIHEKCIESDTNIIECHLFRSDFNQIINEYVSFLAGQEDVRVRDQLIMVVFQKNETNDTLIKLSTSRYIGAFVPSSKYNWRKMGKIGKRNVYIGDCIEMIGINFLNLDSLTSFQNPNDEEILPEYSDYYFENSTWNFVIRNDTILKK